MELHSFVSDVTDSFAESNNSFLILQEHFVDSFILFTIQVLYTTTSHLTVLLTFSQSFPYIKTTTVVHTGSCVVNTLVMAISGYSNDITQ